MEDISGIFVDFFTNKGKSGFATTLRKRDTYLSGGYFNDLRVREFAKFASTHRATQLSGTLWIGLSGKVYRLTQDWMYVVLARYDDGTILWLDDHLDDHDFDSFARREYLADWLPDRLNDMLELLLETKFYFLGWPQLIRAVSEIPVIPEKYIGWLKGPKDDRWSSILDQQKGLESLRQANDRLASVADQIRIPECVRLENGNIRLSFYVWTKILGNVVRIDSFFGTDSSFGYEFALLTKQVGFFTVPR
jgi:hypothetical protein